MPPPFAELGTPTPGRASLVLLHAFPLDHRMWLPVAERLAAGGAHVVLPDAPGLGAAGLPPSGTAPDLTVAADGVATVLDHLNLPRAVVGGCSMGGYTALAFAERHRDRLAGLALVDSRAGSDGDEPRANRERIAQALLGEAGSRALSPMLTTLLGGTSRARRPDVVAQVQAMLAAAPVTGAAWSQRAMAARPDRTSLLRQLAEEGLRAVVVVGEEDELSPVAQAEATALALLCPLVVVPECGHLSPLEDPDPVAQALRLLLEEVDGRP